MLRTLAAVLLVLLVSGFDTARDERGHPLRWPDREVAVFVQSAPVHALKVAEVETIVGKAIASWNAVPTSRLKLVYGGLVHTAPRFDIFIHVGFSGFEQRGDDVLVRVTRKADDDGTLRRVDIELDGQHFTFTSTPKFSIVGAQADLQAVITHALGKAVGVGLSRDPDATMYFLPAARSFRSLSGDDERGITFAYPAGAAVAGGLCDACDGNDQCDDGFCATWRAGRKSSCARACATHDDCPVGFSCGKWAAGKACFPNERHCDPSLATVQPSGLCASDNACDKELACLATGDGGFCTAGCLGSCGTFGSCRTVVIGNQSVNLCIKGSPGALGQPCRAAPDCQKLTCAPSVFGGGRCSQVCVDDSGCPPGFACDMGTPTALCTKKGALAVSWPCRSGLDCETGLCAQASGPFSNVCTRPCTLTTDCPAGTGCTPTTKGSMCLPFGGAQLGGPCATAGACGSKMVCDPSDIVGVGACRFACDPFGSGNECLDGGRCAWVGAASPKLGACRSSAGGALDGAACSMTNPCRPDLVCFGTDGKNGVCAADCDVIAGGCAGSKTCVELTGSVQIQGVRRGACAAAGTTGPVRAVEHVHGAPAGSNFAAVELDMTDEVLPYGSVFADDNADDDDPAAAAGGCGAASAPTSNGGSCVLLLMLMLGTTSRRRRARGCALSRRAPENGKIA